MKASVLMDVSTFCLIMVFSSCSTWRLKKKMIGCYGKGESPNTLLIDSTRILGPQSVLSIALVTRKRVYVEIPYRGDGGGPRNKDGKRMKLMRRGKWTLSADTLHLSFEGYGERLNSTYLVLGDSLLPIEAPNEIVWVKGDCD